MLNIYKYEGKTEDDAIKKCIEELNEQEENLYIKKTETEASLFKSKKIQLEVILKKDVLSYIKEYIKELSILMNIDIKAEIRETEGIYNIQLLSENNSILIGKEGRTIAAIQLLLRQSIENKTHQNIKLNMDVCNYKAKKLKNLEREVKKIAYEVLATKVDVSLDPMNSYERRTIHNLISQFDRLSTESQGEGTERHIVIKYIGE